MQSILAEVTGRIMWQRLQIILIFALVVALPAMGVSRAMVAATPAGGAVHGVGDGLAAGLHVNHSHTHHSHDRGAPVLANEDREFLAPGSPDDNFGVTRDVGARPAPSWPRRGAGQAAKRTRS